MPVRSRRAGEAGFTLVVVLGALLVSALLSVAAFAAVNNDMRESGKDIGRKQALAAAEAGVNDYLFHLNQDNAYWAKCTAVATPNAVNDAWNGTLPDPRTWRSVPGSSAAYTIELLPVAPYTKCTPGATVADSMIDRSSRSLRIRVTGRVPTAKGMDYRSLIGAVKRDGFLDFLYFTDYETSDAVWYALSTSGRPTGGPQGDVIGWAAANCNTTYYYNGRGSLRWNGKYTDTNTTAPQVSCSQIQFADNDVVAGPLHTNDDLYTCNNPTFGRTVQDRIESGDGYRTACGASEAPNFKGTFLTKQKAIGMPATNAQLATIAKPAYTFSGAQQITLASGGITVKNIRTGITTSLAYPTNGVIYVKNDPGGSCPSYQPLNPDAGTNYCGNVRLTGSYGADLTIATENDIIIDGNVTRSGDALLGLIANQFVRVANPSTPGRPRPAFRLELLGLVRQHRRDGRSHDRGRHPLAASIRSPSTTTTADTRSGRSRSRASSPSASAARSAPAAPAARARATSRTTSTTTAWPTARRRTSWIPSSRRGASRATPSSRPLGTASGGRRG